MAADFSTSGGISGAAGDITDAAALDAYVQNLAASSITTQVTDSSTANPPVKLANAQWTSGGSAYLMTRATGNRATVLMATLVNNTGTNCNMLHLNYQFTVGASFTEEVPGQRLYYSFSTASNAWTSLPAVSGLNASGLVSTNVPLNQTWTNGSTLYLLWVDDNAADSTESAYAIDNFFASAFYTNIPLSLTLTGPANGQHFGFGAAISASVALTGTPTNVSYYVDGSLVTTRTTAPFTPVTLPAQALGAHTVYVTAESADSSLLTTATNTFMVDLSLSGTVSSNTTLSAANSPYTVVGNLTVASGATLTIEPGTTLQFGSGINLTVAIGGRLLAEGTSNAPIRFTRSSASGYWGHLTINGDIESRLAYVHFEFNLNSTGTPCIELDGGTGFFDHLTFGNTSAPYMHLDNGSSFVIQDCEFPSATPGVNFELVHGTGGIKTGGRGIFRRNFFGLANSISGNYNDVLDFTGGNRPNGPILQFYRNVFIGSDDDCLDLDGTDAWVEGNIFLHTHRNGAPDSSSGVSGGSDSGSTSEITIIGNIFYDCDQAAMAKQGNFYTLLNNTIVHQTHTGGVDTDGAVICLVDAGFTEGAGMYLEGNLVYDAEKFVRGQTASIVTYTNNLLANVAQGGSWTGPGGNNATNIPVFKHLPTMAETTNFTNWASAQVLWDWLSLQPGSPGVGSGPGGRDQGAVVSTGVILAGEPTNPTTNTSATLRVAWNRTGSGIPTAGFPGGSGYTAYKWRLDTNAWSAETPVSTVITLTNLAEGPHHVEAVGKNDAGLYQDDPLLGSDAAVTLSRTWTVQTTIEPRLQYIGLEAGMFTFGFDAQAGKTYSALYSDELPPLSWHKLTDLTPATNGLQTVTDSAPPIKAQRFYRLVTPAQ